MSPTAMPSPLRQTGMPSVKINLATLKLFLQLSDQNEQEKQLTDRNNRSSSESITDLIGIFLMVLFLCDY